MTGMLESKKRGVSICTVQEKLARLKLAEISASLADLLNNQDKLFQLADDLCKSADHANAGSLAIYREFADRLIRLRTEQIKMINACRNDHQSAILELDRSSQRLKTVKMEYRRARNDHHDRQQNIVPMPAFTDREFRA